MVYNINLSLNIDKQIVKIRRTANIEINIIKMDSFFLLINKLKKKFSQNIKITIKCLPYQGKTKFKDSNPNEYTMIIFKNTVQFFVNEIQIKTNENIINFTDDDNKVVGFIENCFILDIFKLNKHIEKISNFRFCKFHEDRPDSNCYGEPAVFYTRHKKFENIIEIYWQSCCCCYTASTTHYDIKNDENIYMDSENFYSEEKFLKNLEEHMINYKIL